MLILFRCCCSTCKYAEWLKQQQWPILRFTFTFLLWHNNFSFHLNDFSNSHLLCISWNKHLHWLWKWHFFISLKLVQTEWEENLWNLLFVFNSKNWKVMIAAWTGDTTYWFFIIAVRQRCNAFINIAFLIFMTLLFFLLMAWFVKPYFKAWVKEKTGSTKVSRNTIATSLSLYSV